MASKLLIVIGCLDDEDHIKRVVRNVASGIEMWMDSLPLQEQEELVQILNNIPSTKSIPNRNAEDGTVVSRYGGRILDTTILISPTSENLHSELVDLFRTATSGCLVAYGGFFSEAKADWILQDGLFSFNHFKQVFEDPKVATALSEHKIKVTITGGCCKLGLWKTAEGVFSADSDISVKVMDSQGILTTDHNSSGDHLGDDYHKKQSNIEGFSTFLEEGIGNEIGGIFNTLKPPLQEGFLKIRNPCLYIFPGGNGDSAFFTVNGFNMLVNGGACSKPWFWKLIQHVDRVDSILATHLGSDNLPGLNSLMLRKLQERQVKLPMDNTTPEYQELRRCLISPDLGPLFINAPTKFLESINKTGSSSCSPKANGKVNGASPHSDEYNSNHPVLKTVDVVKDTLRLSKALNMEMIPLIRKPGTPEPVMLFSKIGLGRLDMYVISPSESSKELAYVNEKWGCNGKTSTPNGKTGVVDTGGNEGDSSVTNLSSVCALLVWHPSNPNGKIVRVLFPGNASQTKIFEGLETLKNLPFLKAQYVTKNVLKQKNAMKTNGAHPPPKAARPTSAASASKKPATTAPKKTTPVTSSAPIRKEPASTTKVPEKKMKTDKPGGTRTKPAIGTTKTSTTREKVPPKAVKTDTASAEKVLAAQKPSRKPATSRPVNAHSKTDSKRPASAPKATARPKPQMTSKVADKAKKPQTLMPSKQKVDVQKSTLKKSPRQTPKKQAVEKKMTTEKAVKKTKPVPTKVVATPPEDLTPDFSKLEGEKKSVTKPELLSTGSEDPTTSILSDRHSPEGEDGSTVPYAESPTFVLEEKDEKQNFDQVDEPQQTDFVIMNKPEISEESDMISTNGSSAAGQQQSPVVVVEHEMIVIPGGNFISSDKSTPEDAKQQDKAVKFVNVDGQDESDAHKPVGRLPTPFHSLQDSSGTTETSPISESADMAANDDLTKDDVIENDFTPRVEGDIESETGENDIDQEGVAVGQEDLNLREPDTNLALVTQDPADVGAPNDTNVLEPARDIGSDVHSSFNSSIEGSYELYPTGRSPPPASVQETIAETMSDFKHDEVLAAEDLEDPSACMDTQTHQVELFEDPTMSTEAPDPRYSMSTTSTGSQFARIDTPFSPSEVGLASNNDPSLTAQQEPAEPQSKETDLEEVNENHKPEADQDTALEMEKCEGGHPNEEECEGGDVDEEKAEKDEFEEVKGEIPGEIGEKPDVEEELHAVKDNNLDEKKAFEPDNFEPCPQEVWTEEEPAYFSEEKMHEEHFELHAPQQEEERELEEKQHLVDYGITGSEVKDENENKLVVSATNTIGQHEDENDNDDMIQLTGSLASSAQDQGLDENSEATSLTETGATSDSEQPESGFDYGPNVKDYDEEGNVEVISNSNLHLTENFALHGGVTPDQDLLGLDGKMEQEEKDSQVLTEGLELESESSDVWIQREESPSSMRYHPAHVDPSAPLADTEEEQSGIDQLKPAELDSPLDVFAKPFVPKTSVPIDQSPTYGAGAHFGQGDCSDTYNAAAPTSPLSSNNPFLADLMSNADIGPFDLESACLPPTREPDPCAAQDKNPRGATKKTTSGMHRKLGSGTSPIYVDLAYVPNHGNKNSVGVDFFKNIRSKYYVISGNDQSRDEPSADVLNHLLEGKRSWFSEPGSNLSDQDDKNVTVIPTHDTHTVGEWYKENCKELESCNIHMVASDSKVLVQVESIDACKIEF